MSHQFTYRHAIFFAFTGLLLSILCVNPTFAQQEVLQKMVRELEGYQTSTLQEKLFVHTDRSTYVTGETMWLKIYCMDAFTHVPLATSKVAYIELLDRDNKPVQQAKLELTDGFGQGTLFLSTALASGAYSLRAYTRWMQNFNPEFFFYQTIVIINPFVSTPSSQGTSTMAHIDFQLFPEGGHLVSGLQSIIAFRGVDRSGTGLSFDGAVINDNNDTLVRFKPVKFGLGHFAFTPLAGHSYRAVVRDRKLGTSIHPFPVAEPEGWVMKVRDSSTHHILIEVDSKFIFNANGKPFVYILAHAGKKVTASELLFLNQGRASFSIDKSQLGDGITHITLFNSDGLPVCERLYFKKPAGVARIELGLGQKEFGQRRKVNINVSALEANGNPVITDFSLAVFRNDSLPGFQPTDILSSIWLTSELKGEVESPAYHFSESADPSVTDDLMRAQGWSRFKWDNVLGKVEKSTLVVPELNGPIIEGEVLEQTTGKPAHNIITYLASPGKNIRLYISRSNEQGKVRFEMKDFIGPHRIIVQTNYQIDSLYQIAIKNPFSEEYPRGSLHEPGLNKNRQQSLESRSFRMQIQNAFYDDNPNRISQDPVDSLPFYGFPDERYYLDDYTRFPTMEEVMREYVPGVLVRRRKGSFHFLTLDSRNKSVFRDDPMVLVDGVPVFSIDKIMAFDPRKVKRLDVMTQQYFLGPVSFPGVVSYATYKGDLGDFQVDPRALLSRYEGLQWKREFFSPKYETDLEIKRRVPDLRTLLYWFPQGRTQADGKQMISFFTGDVSGPFTVVIQGITRNGEAAYQTTAFQVNDEREF